MSGRIIELTGSSSLWSLRLRCLLRLFALSVLIVPLVAGSCDNEGNQVEEAQEKERVERERREKAEKEVAAERARADAERAARERKEQEASSARSLIMWLAVGVLVAIVVGTAIGNKTRKDYAKQTKERDALEPDGREPDA